MICLWRGNGVVGKLVESAVAEVEARFLKGLRSSDVREGRESLVLLDARDLEGDADATVGRLKEALFFEDTLRYVSVVLGEARGQEEAFVAWCLLEKPKLKYFMVNGVGYDRRRSGDVSKESLEVRGVFKVWEEDMRGTFSLEYALLKNDFEDTLLVRKIVEECCSGRVTSALQLQRAYEKNGIYRKRNYSAIFRRICGKDRSFGSRKFYEFLQKKSWKDLNFQEYSQRVGGLPQMEKNAEKGLEKNNKAAICHFANYLRGEEHRLVEDSDLEASRNLVSNYFKNQKKVPLKIKKRRRSCSLAEAQMLLESCCSSENYVNETLLEEAVLRSRRASRQASKLRQAATKVSKLQALLSTKNLDLGNWLEAAEKIVLATKKTDSVTINELKGGLLGLLKEDGDADLINDAANGLALFSRSEEEHSTFSELRRAVARAAATHKKKGGPSDDDLANFLEVDENPKQRQIARFLDQDILQKRNWDISDLFEFASPTKKRLSIAHLLQTLFDLKFFSLNTIKDKHLFNHLTKKNRQPLKQVQNIVFLTSPLILGLPQQQRGRYYFSQEKDRQLETEEGSTLGQHDDPEPRLPRSSRDGRPRHRPPHRGHRTPPRRLLVPFSALKRRRGKLLLLVP